MKAQTLAALAVIGTTAAAQDFFIPAVESDPGVLLTCLGSGEAVEMCLDRMTQACMDGNDLGNDNLKERLCVVEEKNVWTELNFSAESKLQSVLSEVPPAMVLGSGTDAFEAAELSWEGYVDSRCRLTRIMAGQSGRRAILQDRCARDLAAAHYADLQRMLEERYD